MNRILWALVLLALPPAAPAHDYWIQPDRFSPPLNRPLAVRVFVGDHFKSEAERPFQKKLTPRVQLISVNKTVDLLPTGREGKTPLAVCTCQAAGHHWLTLERNPVLIKLEADRFNRYLAEEGLQSILDQRRLAKEANLPGRERYSRYLKCLLRADGSGDNTWQKVLGQRMEIVLLADPHAVKVGQALRVRLLFEGKPLPKTTLFALRKVGDRVTTQKLQTTEEGIAEVKLTGAGVWLLRLVHMRRCQGSSDADWESFWTALTFERK